MSVTAPSGPPADAAQLQRREPDRSTVEPPPTAGAVTAGTGTELFVPELVLGPDELGASDAAAIARFVRDVAVARGFPLHLAVAWNALHFGYDLAARSYPSEVLRWFVPTIGLDGAANPAVPVGALAWVHVGGAEGDVWAEVVAKDGRPAGGDEEVVDPALAGAAAPTVVADGFEMATVTEALVVDFEAFGPLPDGLDRRLGRLQRRGRLDRHGLILTDALYHPPEAASDDDIWFYARWLVDHQPELLRAGPLGAAADAGALADALLASIEAVSAAVSSFPGLRRWGDYVLPAEWVDEVDAEENLPLGAADLTYVLRGLARSGEAVPAAATLLGRVEPLVPSGDPSRPDHEVPDPLGGVGFVRRVVRSNRWLADRINANGGAVEVGGRLVAVRVDDAFPYGGLWRAEPVVAGHPLLDVPADAALNLGRLGVDALADYLGVDVAEVLARIAAAEAAAVTQPEPGDSPDTGRPDTDGPAAMPEEDELDPTLLSATVTLRATDVDDGTVRLPEAWGWLSGQVTVMLSHVGDIDDDQRTQAAERDGARLGGLSWPLDFFPGVRLHLSVFAGGSTVFASTLPLVPPVGDLGFVFDPAVAGPNAGSGGGQPSDGGGVGEAVDGDGEPAGLDLVEVLIGVLCRRGRRASDGSRRASARDLAMICFGRDRPAGADKVIAATLEPAVDDGRLTMVGSEYRWETGGPPRPGRATRPSGWGDRARPVRTVVAAAHVPGFVRRLAPGFTASAEKRASYAQARADGDILFGPEVLPEGYTWVRPHERGGAGIAYDRALAGIVSTVSGLSPGAAELAEMRRAWGLAETAAAGRTDDDERGSDPGIGEAR